MATLPSGVGYGTVNWTAVQLVVDGTGDQDSLPDLVPMTGSVTFTPTISRARVPGTTPPLTLFVRPVIGTLYADGTLRDPQGRVGVSLLATDSIGLDVLPGSWGWVASFAVVNGPVDPVSFQLASGASVDLTALSSVNVGPGSVTNVSYSYNADKKPISATDGEVTQTYTYAAGKLVDVGWSLAP